MRLEWLLWAFFDKSEKINVQVLDLLGFAAGKKKSRVLWQILSHVQRNFERGLRLRGLARVRDVAGSAGEGSCRVGVRQAHHRQGARRGESREREGRDEDDGPLDGHQGCCSVY